MPPDRSSPESSEAVDGFTLHFGGKFNFKQELNVVEYVGGRSHHWAVQPKDLTMVDLHNIILQVVDGDISDVLSIHFKKPGVNIDDGLYLVENDEDLEELMVEWILYRKIEVYVEVAEESASQFNDAGKNKGKSVVNDEIDFGFEGDDEDGGCSDEESLDDVSFCSEGGDDEFTELINNAKSYTVETVIEEIKQRGAEDTVGNQSDSNYSIDTNYMDDPDVNWSMSDDDDCVVDSAACNDNDSDGVEPMNVEGFQQPRKQKDSGLQ
ncbi:hypothetical protein ACFE04_010461 [Oxalis oulophora]